jgi:hypothetical protein
MNLPKLSNNPEKLIPIAMMFITVGMMLLVLANVWQRPFVPAHSGTNWNDFSRGFVMGIAIVMEIAGLVIALAAARAKKTIENGPAPRP